MEKLNIEGKRSGEGFVATRSVLITGLVKAMSPRVRYGKVELGRKGLISYLRALGGSNVVKVAPQDKGLRVVCGANTGFLANDTWVTEKMAEAPICEFAISPIVSVLPNIGASELADAIARVIPFVSHEKDDARPVLKCVWFHLADGKLTLTSADGYRYADTILNLEGDDGDALIEASELRGLVPALRRAYRARLSFANGGERLDSRSLIIETEAVSYTFDCVEGSFPTISEIIPTEAKGDVRCDSREMMRASASLNALGVASIVITVGDGKLTLTSPDARGESIIEAEAQGNAQTAISGAYLTQTLKALDGMVEMRIADPSQPVVFTLNGSRVIVMPIRTPDVKVEAKADAVEQAEKVATDAEAEAKAVKPKRKHKAKVEAIA